MKAVHCIPPQEVKEYKKLDEQLQYQVKVECKKDKVEGGSNS